MVETYEDGYSKGNSEAFIKTYIPAAAEGEVTVTAVRPYRDGMIAE